MCGIAGIVDPGSTAEVLRHNVQRMSDALRHRGPDGSGVWTSAERGIALGHRRLAIIDLTEDGHQPMVSRSGRLVITFNGEIYNYKALRRDLESRGRKFSSHSDTEVMLEAIEEWGLLAALERFVGMFAFVLWDRERLELSLVRDRIGKKPLYYSESGGRFLFASELKAFTALPGFDARLDRDALAQYFSLHYIPAPLTIYQGARKLRAGSLLTVDCASGRPVVRAEHRYWSPAAVFKAASEKPFTGTEDEAFERVNEILREAVQSRMVSDVPIGAFLSGGVDSSAVVAHMQSLSSRPVRTFTIGTRHATANEAEHAAAIARHLGTEHTEFYVEPNHALEVIPQLPRIYDEPFADSSQIPTYLVSRLARTHVTVGLSGDGGDEVFVGYNRHLLAARLSRVAARIPAPGLWLANGLSQRLSAGQWAWLLGSARAVLPAKYRQTAADDRLTTLADMLSSRWPWGIYEALVRHWDENPSLVRGAEARPALELGGDPPSRDYGTLGSRWASLTRDMVLADESSYLPDDVLVKVDRASMAASLEARAPYLDHRLIEFMASVPVAMSLRDGVGKRLLRRSLYQHVPRALIERPKTGFGVPIDQWLRGDLREWAEELLGEQRLRAEGILEPRPIRAAWSRHLAGTHQEHHRLWSVLMFQAWLEQSRAATSIAASAAA